MFWHVSSGLEVALGTLSCEPGQDSIFTRTVLKRMVLYGPWPKGRIDTLKEITATDRYDTEAERQRLLELVEAFATRELEGPWPGHPLFGRMRGREQSHLHGRHLDYHLQQFGS